MPFRVWNIVNLLLLNSGLGLVMRRDDAVRNATTMRSNRGPHSKIMERTVFSVLFKNRAHGYNGVQYSTYKECNEVKLSAWVYKGNWGIFKDFFKRSAKCDDFSWQIRHCSKYHHHSVLPIMVSSMHIDNNFLLYILLGGVKLATTNMRLLIKLVSLSSLWEDGAKPWA